MEIEYPTNTEDDNDITTLINPDESYLLAKAGALDALARLCVDLPEEELGQYAVWQNAIETAPPEAFDASPYLSEPTEGGSEASETGLPEMPSAEETAMENVRKILCPDESCGNLTLDSIRYAVEPPSYSVNIKIKGPPGPCDDLGSAEGRKECLGAVIDHFLRM